MTTFSDFLLHPGLQQALEKMAFQTPTPIQAQTIPLMLQGRDVIGCAQTGTGKTGAFGIPLIHRLIEHGGSSLILVPTRELAVQVEAVLADLTQDLPQLTRAVLVGGLAMSPQIKALKLKPAIIVATPGRLVDHLMRRTLSLQDTKTLVLDEADRMLDMGFWPQLQRVLEFLPSERQTLLFSATLAPEIEVLAQKVLRQPEKIVIGTVSKPTELVVQKSLEIKASEKNHSLVDELNARADTVLVFARTQTRADRLQTYLVDQGFKVAVLHGGRTQAQRSRALQSFREGDVRILVATDIAGRGLDIPHVGLVINYDLPQASDDYIHRIGRTGRSGRTGEALSFVTPEDKTLWLEISRALKGGSGNGYRHGLHKGASDRQVEREVAKKFVSGGSFRHHSEKRGVQAIVERTRPKLSTSSQAKAFAPAGDGRKSPPSARPLNKDFKRNDSRGVVRSRPGSKRRNPQTSNVRNQAFAGE